MTETGLLTEVRSEWTGTVVAVDAAAGATTLTVDHIDALSTREVVWISGTGPYTITAIAGSVITVTPALTEDMDEGDPVVPDAGGQPAQIWVAEVVLADADQPIEVQLSWLDRITLSERIYDPPRAVTLSDDLTRIVNLPDQELYVAGTRLEPNMVLANRFIATDSLASFDIPPPLGVQVIAFGAGALNGTFFYVVTAVTAGGEESIRSEEKWENAVNVDSMTINWDPVENAAEYRVYRGTVTATEDELISSQAPQNANVGQQTFSDDGSAGTAQVPPLGARAEMSSTGFEAFDQQGVRTVLIDAATGDASFVGEIGTAMPGDKGIFMYSLKFDQFGSNPYTRPVIQFNVEATRDQPSIQSDDAGGANLYLFSGACTNCRETMVNVEVGHFYVGIEEVANDEAYAGTYLNLTPDIFDVKQPNGAEFAFAEDNIWLGTPETFTGSRLAKFQANAVAVFSGYENTASGRVYGFQYLTDPYGDQAKIFTSNLLQVRNPLNDAYRGADGGAWNNLSDAREKSNEVKVSSALDVIADLDVYDYDTKHGATDENPIRRGRGVMAQDLQQHVPHVVREMEDGLLGVDLYGFIATVAAAVKELNEKVEAKS